jgi:3-oxoacyl-[acyl-carrier protein] reductase
MSGVAVVTGGGRGIGRAVALQLAKRGLDIALWSRTVEETEQVAAEVTALGRRALGLRCDVANAGEVAHAAQRVKEVLGVPRAVVCSAGVVHRAPVVEMSEGDWDHVVSVNLKGTFLVARALLPAMLEAERGRIVAIGSISSTLGTPRLSAYCAAKWGVVGFIKSLAEEVRGRGVQAMSVLPGSVDTAMLKGGDFAPQMTPDQVAGVVTYAALDAPDAMNGSAIEAFGP